MFTKRNISLALVALSFVWIITIIYQNYDDFYKIGDSLKPDSFLYIVLSTILMCLAIALLVPLFKIIVFQNMQRNFPTQYLARLFFAGQIVSYLPGRFLGVAYIINETQKFIPPLVMIRINIEMILTIMVFNIFAASSIISFAQFGPTLAAALMTGGIILFFVFLRANLFDSFLQILSRIFPEKISGKFIQTKTHRPYEYKTILQIITLLIIHWVLYLCAWFYLRQVFVILDSNIVFLLAATYTISWIIGFVTMITPGGLGIREVSFALLSSKYLAQHHASILSLFLRIWFICVDLCLFLISHILLKIFPCSIEEN